MITNIVDYRHRPHRFKRLNAVVEAAWHDNGVHDADLVYRGGSSDDGPAYEEREHISLTKAIEWAGTFATDVALYLYDDDAGIYAPRHVKWKRVASR